MSWIIFLTETDDTISPSPDAMPLWKKNFSSNNPCGVSTYLFVVTRLIVDSCIPMSSPTSRSDSGRVGQPPVQELALEFDDRLRHLAQGPLALVHALDQPQRGAELLLDVLLRLVPGTGAPEERAVERIDPEAWDAVLVEDDGVVVAELVHEDVGHDVARVVAAESPAGLGFEAHDFLDRLHDPIDGKFHGPRDVLVAPAAQVVEVRLDDLDRDRVGQRVALQLEQEALLDGSRRHAGGVEALHQLEDPGHP